MPRIKVFYDQVGSTLTVWFGDMQDEYLAEQAADDVILIKDTSGRVIGFEKLNLGSSPEHLQLTLETVST